MKLEEKDWDTLLARIKAGTCTPFLGAAVNHGILPLGGEIASAWADEYDFPLESRSDLAKVSQFLAIRYDATRPKELILDKLDKAQKPFNFADDEEPLNVLAKLPLPVYITTNYDDLLVQAVQHHGRATKRVPDFEICQWNSSPALQPRVFKKESTFKPSVQTPLIYHLHGHKDILDSIVLTDDDYLDFLVSMSKNINSFLPPRIQEAITGASVLFVGYSLQDIDFRVLFRGLLGNLQAALGKMSVAVQLPYSDANPNKEKAEAYITEYYGRTIRVYWGTARQFTADLAARWKKFNA